MKKFFQKKFGKTYDLNRKFFQKKFGKTYDLNRKFFQKKFGKTYDLNRKFFPIFLIFFLFFSLFFSNAYSLQNSSTISSFDENSFSEKLFIEDYDLPLVVPPDPFNQQLIQMQLDELAKKKVKDFFTSVVPEFMQNEAEDKIKSEYEKQLIEGAEAAEKALLKKYPKYEKYIKDLSKTVGKAINWMNIAVSLKDAGDAFNGWVAVHSNPYATSQEKLDADIAFYDSGFSSLSSMLPPGFSHAALAITKAGTAILQGMSEKGELEAQQWQAQLAQSNAQLAETMESTWNTYGTSVKNKTLIASVMTDDQIVDHVLGTGVGPQGQPLQSAPDQSILNYVSDDKKKDIAKKMISKAANGQLPITVQQAKQVISQFPIGSGFVIKNSPFYMVITDPFGKKFGVSPETKDVLCEAEEVFCSAPFKNDELQLISTPALFEGKYNIKLYGFADGEFTFSFTAFNLSQKVESIQDIKGFIKKGQILEADIELLSKGNEYGEEGFNVNEIEFKESSETFDVPKNPLDVPFKVLSISPDNASIFRTEKPVIKVRFNKPLAENVPFNVLFNNKWENIPGISLIDGTILTFVPAVPLPENEYTVVVKGLKDKFGVKLSNELSSSFTVVREFEEGIDFELSNPVVLKINKRTELINNTGSSVTNIKFKSALLQDFYPNVFVNYLSSSTEPYKIEEDSYNNLWGYWEVPSIASGEKFVVDSNFLVLAFKVNYFDFIDFSDLEPVQQADKQFMNSFECIESDDAAVKEQANKIAGKSSNDFEKALQLYDWTIKNIKYLYAEEGEAGGAVQTLNSKKGICHSFACLYGAFLRSQGIQAKYVRVVSLEGNKADTHAMNEFYLPEYGWLPVDATWGKEVNDWFLVSDTSHIKFSELYPPSWDGWLSYNGGPLTLGDENGIFETLDSSFLWKEDLKLLFESVSALSFKKTLLNKLPEDINVNISYSKAFLSDLNAEISTISADYNHIPNVYTELSHSLDAELLLVQNEIEKYFEENDIDSEKLKDTTTAIYSDVLNESVSSFEKLKQRAEEIAEKYKVEMKKFDSTDSDDLADYLSRNVYLYSEEKNVLLGDLFDEENDILLSAENFLKQNDYNKVRETLLLSANNLSAINQAIASFSFDCLAEAHWAKESLLIQEEIQKQIEGNIISEPEDMWKEIENALETDQNKNLLVQGAVSATLSDFLITFIVFALFIFWLLMLANCLKAKEFKHLNKIIWFLLIFFTLLIFAGGAILYFLLEYLPKRKKRI